VVRTPFTGSSAFQVSKDHNTYLINSLRLRACRLPIGLLSALHQDLYHMVQLIQVRLAARGERRSRYCKDLKSMAETGLGAAKHLGQHYFQVVVGTVHT
jgi:hypothetical protein